MDQSPARPAQSPVATTTATPSTAASVTTDSGDSVLHAAFESLSLRTPDSRQRADSIQASAESSIQPDGQYTTNAAADNQSVGGTNETRAAEPVPHAPLGADAPFSADAAATDISRARDQGQAHDVTPAAEQLSVLTPTQDSERQTADSSPEPATPQPTSSVSVVIPSAAITIVPATPSAPDADPRIKVHRQPDSPVTETL